MTTALLKPLSALTIAMALAAPVQASVVSAQSGGYGLSAGVDLLKVNLLTLQEPSPAAYGSTPGNYDDEQKTVSLAVDVKNTTTVLGIPVTNAEAKVDADVLTGESHFDGTTAQGLGSIENLAVGIDATVLWLTPVVGITLDSLYSESNAWEDPMNTGNVMVSGDSTITNLKVSLLGVGLLDLSADAYVHAGANTEIDPLGLLTALGIFLTLNEQTTDCTQDQSSCRIETNALHLWANPLSLGLAGLDIKLGHSWAQMAAAPSAVPLPGTWAMMLGGLGVLGTFARRRKQTA